MKLVVYARVSTEEQDSIEAQIRACGEWALRNAGEIVATETDKISGLNTQRPGYLRVLEMARRGEIEGVVV